MTKKLGLSFKASAKTLSATKGSKADMNGRRN